MFPFQGYNLGRVIGLTMLIFALMVLPYALLVLAVLTLYTFWRSTVKTLSQGGIYGRGTFYPITKLKQQSGLEGLP